MNHSRRGNLRKRSTEELEAMLHHYLRGKNYVGHSYAILKILRILRRRDEKAAANKD